MEFEQPELAEALRELAIERDASMAGKRQTYVDYDAEGRIERITWPEELGALPEQASINARIATIRTRRSQRPRPQPPELELPGRAKPPDRP